MQALLDYLQDPATPLGPIDLVWGLYLLYGLIRGAFRGLPRELAGLLGTLITLFVAWKFYTPVSDFIRENTRLDSAAGSSLLAYVLLLFTLFLTLKGITFAFRKALDWTCPGQLKAWGGGMLGTTKALVVLTVLIFSVHLSNYAPAQEHLVENSLLGRQITRLLPEVLHEQAPNLFPEPETRPEEEDAPEDQPAAPPPAEEDQDGSGDA